MKLHEQSQQLSALIQGAGASIVQVLGRARLPASAVVWSSEGDRALLLTANHVIEHGHSVRVTLADGERIAASIVGRDPKNDLALLQIPRAARPAAWADDAEAPPVGEIVLAVGRPFGSLEASLGIIRAPALGQTKKDDVAPKSENAEGEDTESTDSQGSTSELPWSDDFDIDDPWQDTIEKLGRSAERAVQHAEEIARRAVRNFELRYENEEDEWDFPPRRRRRPATPSLPTAIWPALSATCGTCARRRPPDRLDPLPRLFWRAVVAPGWPRARHQYLGLRQLIRPTAVDIARDRRSPANA